MPDTPIIARRYSICFYLSSVPFSRRVIEGRTSLGGSESACITTARALAAMGHDVRIFADKLAPDAAGIHDGVIWLPSEMLAEHVETNTVDSLVSLRAPALFARPMRANHRALWAQDLRVSRDVTGMAGIDEIYFVSDYQRRQWHAVTPELARIPSNVVINPIDTGLIDGKPGRAFGRYVAHISRPERSYDALMAVWPRIRGARPDLTLRLARYSSVYDDKGWGEVVRRYEDRITQLDGVHLMGELDKAALYRMLSGAALMLYPTSQPGFAETNCIAATEAMACGCPIVADRRGALPETAPGRCDSITLIDNPDDDAWRSEKYQDAVVEAALRAVDDAPDVEEARSLARERTGERAALLWSGHLDRFFDDRYQARKAAVLRRCVHDDNFVHARTLAEKMEDDGGATDESRELGGLSRRVIAQIEQGPSDYAARAVEPDADMEDQRQAVMAARLFDSVKYRPVRTLDLACGNGAWTRHVMRRAADKGVKVEAVIVDFSPDLVDRAEAAIRAELPEGCSVKAHTCDALAFLDTYTGPTFGIVFSGEFLEHVEAPEKLVAALSKVTAGSGIIGVTTPSGPIHELLPWHLQTRTHTHNYERNQLERMLSGQREVSHYRLAQGNSQHSGRPIGYWLLTWRPNPNAVPEGIDYERELRTMRPHERLTACMIARDAEDDIGAAIKSLRAVDRVHVYDTGSVDMTRERAEALNAEVTEGYWPDSFSSARNLGLEKAAPDSDWILWMDCDERLVGGHQLRWLLESPMFEGYVIRQRHLQADADTFDDKPVRLFRAGRGIRFEGSVHEQPAMGVGGGPVEPVALVEDAIITHYGYATAGDRMRKLQRNWRLLAGDIDRGTSRSLSWALWLRDLCQQAQFSHDPAESRRLMELVVKTFRERWPHPEIDVHNRKVAWEHYQAALAALGAGVVVQAGVAASVVEEPKAAAETWRAFDWAEAEAELDYRTRKVLREARPVDPILV